MSERTEPLTIYLTSEEKARITEWSDKADMTLSELGRAAFREYLDKDRSARIEDKLDRLLAQVGDISDDDAHTHMGTSEPRTVPEKAREVARTLINKDQDIIKERDLHIEIENLSGSDERTVEKHENQLKKRGLLFRHPNQPVWTSDREQFVKWVGGSTVGDMHITEELEDYDIDYEEFDEIMDRIEAQPGKEKT